ncbi:DUF1425 domain-containing protein [Paraferrimonas sp. SM1919]|uniref:DUF1425 domain-containing protein n=1 Tax=Paraferrimonas sp. SM1919 TaxID=2662263 RepID=UPI0013D3CD2D|nr:DUF1425 domain-containing protein [Paraferrimonas sp. SM1919]
MKKLFFVFMIITASACSNLNTTSGISINGDGGLQINNNSLSQDLEVSGPTSFRVNNLLQAVVTVTSKKRNDQQLQYQFQFFDTNGIEIEAASSVWQSLNLNGKQSRQLQGLAANDQGVTFRFNIRPVYSQN